MMEIDMSERQKLLERVEKATGPDRGIDESLMVLNHFREERFIGAYYEDNTQALDEVWVDRETNEWRSTHAHEYTASIDAALALVERVLPGWAYQIVSPRKDRGFEGVVIRHHPHTVWCSYHDANAPLAILAALLKALVAQEAVNA